MALVIGLGCVDHPHGRPGAKRSGIRQKALKAACPLRHHPAEGAETCVSPSPLYLRKGMEAMRSLRHFPQKGLNYARPRLEGDESCASPAPPRRFCVVHDVWCRVHNLGRLFGLMSTRYLSLIHI